MLGFEQASLFGKIGFTRSWLGKALGINPTPKAACFRGWGLQTAGEHGGLLRISTGGV